MGVEPGSCSCSTENPFVTEGGGEEEEPGVVEVVGINFGGMFLRISS
jgi:hypothetical protein